MLTPEYEARATIDQMLKASGWQVQTRWHDPLPFRYESTLKAACEGHLVATDAALYHNRCRGGDDGGRGEAAPASIYKYTATETAETPGLENIAAGCLALPWMRVTGAGASEGRGNPTTIHLCGDAWGYKGPGSRRTWRGLPRPYHVTRTMRNKPYDNGRTP
jgi:hypothetical protein